MEKYFAKIENGVVVSVEVVTPEFVAANPKRYKGEWKQVGHKPEQPFVGAGYIKHPSKDKIIEPSPFPSWTLDEENDKWKAPKDKKAGEEDYVWNEDEQKWEKPE